MTLPMSPPDTTDALGTMVSAGTYARSIAYLTSLYPALSQTWLLREVFQLRGMGFRIEVSSVNPPDRPLGKMTSDEASEASSTYYLKTHGVTGAARAHLRALASHTIGYLRGLRIVASLGGLDIRRLAYNFMYFSEGLMVGEWMKRSQLSHVHVHLGSQAATVGLYVRHVFGFGFSITIHGPDEFYDARGQYLEQKVAAADFICCISYYARSQLMRLSPYTQWNKLVVSRLGVDTTAFSPGSMRPAPDIFEILCVGRLTPSKGQHLLISAVEQLVLQGRRVRLRLVGDGPDGPSLRERAAHIVSPESVVFEGAVNQDRIRSLYGIADLFCIPSFAEGIPIVLMEAMAMEIPCVTTHIAGIPELIRDGLDGMLVAASDVEGLVEAISTLIDDTKLRDRIAKSGRARVMEHYELSRSVEGLAAIFAERLEAQRE
jgi:colanic acid/amylovoran biosynthesis glycosyltransferase